ncbi:lysine exporter LysO family protein [Ferrimonas sediminicola]|uniref:Lysine exporter LysO family protein n=1 Tax=Ferrimonas sediminicola TaxID=2569538 RepID=A0A4U1BCA4_9GAMM|nr:lysine exporter LysO family protein [Ferrimonas sediminicola]TKB48092.1 lysine exporter LysO family protein [Ferrimonas sediminicola]
MSLESLIILLPLFGGYLVPVTNRRLLAGIDRILSGIVYLILALMGLSLAQVDNLASELGTIGVLLLTLISLTLTLNLAALPLVDRRWPLSLDLGQSKQPLAKLVMESLKLALVVAAGVVVGLMVTLPHSLIESTANGALMVLLALIGIQLRGSNLGLRGILLNPRGLAIAAVVALTSLAAGALTAAIHGLPLLQGVILASGFGWYSLSGILITDGLGPVLGSVAFLADLSRELIAIVLIPALMRWSPASAIGYGGATAMDFTLPVLQQTGGPRVVPVAIVSGFLLSLATPILIPFLLSLA